MREHFPSAWLPPMEATPFGNTDLKDRHVAAAAVHVAPSVLISWNLPHFDAAALRAYGVKVQTPDALLVELFDEKCVIVMETVHQAQANLTRSAPSWDDYMAALLKCGYGDFVGRLRGYEAGRGRDRPEETEVDDDDNDAGPAP